MKLLSIILLSLSLVIPVSGVQIEDRSQLTIETPSLADRKVRKLRLENGLEALLISDKGAIQSGAAMAVGTGSWNDPKDRPGMAHFVEHLLFLGTEKYPDEEGYSRYLDEHNGKRNAFTMADRTVYSFSINNEGFSDALDRFGQFFIAPLFNPSGVERESKAIHQEFAKNLFLDEWRMLYVRKELANDKHPFHDFCIGNSETLKQIAQDELKAWYKEHYSANLMHLVVYSNKDLDTLEKEVTALFSAVKNHNAPAFNTHEPLVSTNEAPKIIIVKPVQDLRLLEITWEIPRFYGRDRDLHTDKLLSHVLGHEGEFGLIKQLKRENLADELMTGTFRAGADQCLFNVTIQLTPKGIENYETVIQRVFEAIASLRESGFKRYLYDEVATVEEMHYRFQSREDVYQVVTDFASELIDEPLETFPRKTVLPTSFSPQKIEELLAHLTPKNAGYMLVAPEFLLPKQPNKKEKWFGVEYGLVPIAEETLALWNQTPGHRDIGLPRPNPFISENVSVTHHPADNSVLLPSPEVVIDQPNGKLYNVTDDRFGVPEVAWTFRIKTPLVKDDNPKSQVLADLFCYTVAQKLNSIAYDAHLAGMYYSLKPTHGALELKFTGFNEKTDEFMKVVLQGIKEAVPTRAEFEQYRELLGREYMNSASVSPLKQGRELLWSILYKAYAAPDEKVKAIARLSYNEMVSFVDTVFQESYIEGLLYGNQSKETAHSLWSVMDSTLQSAPYPVARHPKIELATLPTSSSLFIKTEHPAHALILTADCGLFSFQRKAAQEILTKGLEEPFFSELRTKQQTAYLVANWSEELERHLYSFFAIQSSSHTVEDLLARFEQFLTSNLDSLSTKVIPKERFDSIKAALIEAHSHPADNLQQMGSLLHLLAFDYDGNFNWIENRITGLKELTYDDFITYAHEFLDKKSAKQLAICVSPVQKETPAMMATQALKLKKAISYKSR